MTIFRNSKKRYTSVLMSIFLVITSLANSQSVMARDSQEATLYKKPSCGCCEEYATYLRQFDYNIEVVETSQVDKFKAEYGVLPTLQSCHTMTIEGYVVEGHVPIDVLNKLLRERPEIRGISLPGMPQGSPGMPGLKQNPFVIYEVSDGEPSIYVTN